MIIQCTRSKQPARDGLVIGSFYFVDFFELTNKIFEPLLMLEEAKQKNHYKSLKLHTCTSKKTRVRHCQAPAVPKTEAAFPC